MVKMAFFQGVSIPDPDRLFNAGREGNRRRAIEFHESDKIDVPGFKSLIRAAVALNVAKKKKRS